MVSRLRGGSRLLVLAIVLLVGIGLVVGGCGKKQEAQKPAEQPKAGEAQKPPEPPKEPYKIGALLEVTGVSSSLGIPEKNTIEMLIDQVNAKGGINGHPVQLVLYDIQSDETKGVLALKKLIEEDKVLAVVGPATSGPSLAMVDTANQAKTLLFSNAASAKITSPVTPWVFKSAQNDAVVINKVIGYMKSKGYKKIAWMNQNDAYGESGRVEFEKQAKGAGLEIVAQEKFERSDTDMTPQLTRVKQKSPDAVLVWAIPPSASVVTKNYRDLGLKFPLIHSHGIGNKTFIDLAGPAADGVVFPIGRLLVAEGLSDGDQQKAKLLEYAKAYESKYGPRSTFGGHMHDSISMVLWALEKAGPDKAKIRDTLETAKSWVGISGVFNMSNEDHNGLKEDALVMVEIKDGKWQLAK
ncbi:MAG: ABC transporter substrate-binding protein [Actinobacteria bacterium]|nr:ABC transporter substrate-binding protein [Actinomycetota bacterium]